tara:strand:+ start:2296 stop:2601 length:306 start_codon:yes stop_codon:yes gene_type:complete
MTIEKQFIIKSDNYSLKQGIRFLKTTVTNNYDELPEDFKDEEVKNSWDLYEGIPLKLYQMSQSKDEETVQLAIKLLKESNISFTRNRGSRINSSKIYLFND